MWRERLRKEEGVALVYVLFATMIITGLIVVFMSRIVFETRSTAQARDYESAIHVAEAGPESLFGAINREGREFDDQIVTPDPTGVNEFVEYDPSQPPADEEAWAIELARRADPSAIIRTDDGDSYAIRPKVQGADEAVDIVFGVGFVPGIDAPDPTVRVVKMRIARHWFSPDHALLTGSSLSFGGNAQVKATACDEADSVTCNADVHANGEVFVNGSTHAVEGDFTTSESFRNREPITIGGTSTAGEEPVDLQPIRARDFYDRGTGLNGDPGGDEVNWYDLCPDGTVKAPSGTPCEGNVLWTSQVGTRYRGWKFQGGQWQGSSVEPGVFYVYGTDAEVNGSAGSGARAVSILVESDEGHDATASGSLEMRGNPNFVSALPDVMFVTDRDLDLHGTAQGGQEECDPATLPDGEQCADLQNYDGFIFVGEQVEVAGTVDLKGALIAENREDSQHPLVSDSVIRGTMTFEYNAELKVNLAGRVTIEHWNEL